MKPDHVIVVGAGVVGTCTARELARRGVRVTLLDRGEVGEAASFGNAGVVAVGHPPLPRPGLVRQGIKWVFDPTSPLYIPPRLDPELWGWLWRFARACERRRFERSLDALHGLDAQAIASFETILAEEKIDCEFRPHGYYNVARTPAGAEAGREEARFLRRYGLEIDEIDGRTLREREPAYRDDVAAAFHYRQSAFANPHRFVTEVAGAATRRGADLRTNTAVAGVTVRNGRFTGVRTAGGDEIAADVLVLAAGIWSTPIAASIGLRVPMQPAKGYHVMLSPPAEMPATACVLIERHVAVTPLSTGLRLAGTVELSGVNHRLDPRRLRMLPDCARLYLRGLDACDVRSEWCGLRPCTADGLPVIGWAPGVNGVFVATGHAKMGFALAPVTARVTAEWILDGISSIDVSAMSPARFCRSAP